MLENIIRGVSFRERSTCRIESGNRLVASVDSKDSGS